MSDVFPKWTNWLPLYLVVGLLFVGSAVTAGVWYYFTPKYTRVGYEPIQPAPFAHSVHVDQLGIDCRYCHTHVDRAWHSNVPTAAACMNCHNQVLREDSRLAQVRETAQSGESIGWVQIHRTPDFVYFNHAVHVDRGVSCVECHGAIHKMEEAYHAQPLSMWFCLDCHRNPAPRLRPLDKVTELDWSWPAADPKEAARLARVRGEELVRQRKVQALENCSACHR